MATTLTYFTLLGVGEGVSQEELETRYQELAEYLSSAAVPAHLQEWARRQTALVDEAYAVLADPERRATARREELAPAEPRAQQSPRANASADGPRQLIGGEDPETELREEAHKKAKRRPSARRAGRPAAERPQGPAALGARRPLGLRLRTVLLGIGIGIIALGVLLAGRYGLPGGGGGDSTEQVDQPGFAIPLDPERVAALMASVEESPDDVELLFELGETFFQAAEWQASIDWFTRLVDIDPSNIHAWTDIGTAHFNLDRSEQAKAAWMTALDLDPNDVQAHYNLGFLYSNAEPRDLASARQEWQKVVELAPDSSLAETAQVHLNGLVEESDLEGLPTPP